MPHLTLDSLMAFRLPDPLVKDVELPELGGSVHIEGIVTREDMKALNDEVSTFREALDKGGLVVQHPATGKKFVPDFSDVVAACWVARCATDPKLTAFQWLQFSAEGYRFLPILFNESMICSRERADEKSDIPEGVDAAVKELEDGSPLESGAALNGDSTA